MGEKNVLQWPQGLLGDAKYSKSKQIKVKEPCGIKLWFLPLYIYYYFDCTGVKVHCMKSHFTYARALSAWIWSYCEVEEQFSFWSKMTFETYITINKRSFQVIDCLKFGIWILCCRLFHKNKKRTQKTIKLTKQTLQKKHTKHTSNSNEIETKAKFVTSWSPPPIVPFWVEDLSQLYARRGHDEATKI